MRLLQRTLNSTQGYRWTKGRSNHSFASPTIQHHIECLESSGDCFQSLFSESWTLDTKTASIQKSLQGLQNVVGIPACKAETLIQTSPYHAATWIERLETWKDIDKGRDVFLMGLGKFDIIAVYEKRARTLYSHFAADVLHSIKSPPIRKAYKQALKTSSLPPAKNNKINGIREWMAQCPTVDLISILGSHLDELDAIIKKKCFLRDNYQNNEMLLRSLCSGENWRYAVPFWLVPVSEVRALGHFSKALDGNKEEKEMLLHYLSGILYKPNENPGKAHLLKHSDYWNDPDNIGSIDELLQDDSFSWPEGWDKMDPRQLLNAIREQTKWEQFGPNIQYEHLRDLPNDGRMRVLRSSHEVAWVADKLHNCARIMTDYVEMELLVLVVLEDASGFPIALGSHSSSHTLLDYDLEEIGWEEIRESCNRRPSDETKQYFHEYSRTFQHWYTTTYVPSL